MNALRIIRSPYASLALNLIYAIGNLAIGFLTHSWWFLTAGAYYAVLTVTRYSVLQIKRKAGDDYGTELFARRFTGILLVILSFCIVGVNVLSALEERGTEFHEIIMIAISVFTFAKITTAIIGLVRAGRSASPVLKTLRNISLADACVSVYSMQRSMLRSFPGMEENGIRLMNILTGTGVWLIVLLLGINLIGGKYTHMAKNKIGQANRKIAKAVTVGYKRTERFFVNGYKKIEHGAVSIYRRIEDWFVEKFLTRENETVEEAKARMKKDKH